MEFNDHRSGMCRPKKSITFNGDFPFDVNQEYRYAPHASRDLVEVRAAKKWEQGVIYFDTREFLARFTPVREGWGK